MKQGFLFIVVLFMSGVLFTGCIKNTPYVTTTNPSMSAVIGSYTFVAKYVTSATVDTQTHDSTIALIITGNTSDVAHPYDKIQLIVNKYRPNTTGVYSIVQSQASATYWHSGIKSYALGGIVAITNYSSNIVSGYFNFDTQDTIHIGNGSFVANRP